MSYPEVEARGQVMSLPKRSGVGTVDADQRRPGLLPLGAPSPIGSI
jgi:hypothetical protein